MYLWLLGVAGTALWVGVFGVFFYPDVLRVWRERRARWFHDEH